MNDDQLLGVKAKLASSGISRQKKGRKYLLKRKVEEYTLAKAVSSTGIEGSSNEVVLRTCMKNLIFGNHSKQ